jgi:hypothetical protein
VADRGSGDDGRLTDRFWASMFDPAANARALSAIQAEGLRAASQLVDRFVRFASPGANPVDQSPAPQVHPTNGDHAADVPGADIERLIRTWLSVTDQFLRGYLQNRDDSLADAVGLDLTNAEAQGSLNLEAAAPGCARGEVWLHNSGAGDLGQVRLRCSDLLAHDGSMVRSDTIVFDPDTVPMPPRSSRGVGVRIDLPQGIPAARYSGTLLAEGYPSLSLPVVLTVNPAAS